MDKHPLSLFIVWFGAFFLLTVSAGAASFDIKPIKISFKARTHAEKLVIRNLSDNDLSLQVTVLKWSQDKEGKDIYEETPDIVIFPKILTIPKGEEKIIRVGTTLKPALREGTYRVYVEELPVKNTQSEQAGLRIVMKVGVPVFISPVKSDEKGTIGSSTMEKGRAVFRVDNNGNTHFIIRTLKVICKNDQGKEIFSKDLGAWYHLSGVSRTYETNIPHSICAKLAKIDVVVKTASNSMKGGLKVTDGMCGRHPE